MQKQIPVWDTKEAVTVLAGKEPGTTRVIWHPSDGSADKEFVVAGEGKAAEDEISKELRSRMPG